MSQGARIEDNTLIALSATKVLTKSVFFDKSNSTTKNNTTSANPLIKKGYQFYGTNGTLHFNTFNADVFVINNWVC